MVENFSKVYFIFYSMNPLNDLTYLPNTEFQTKKHKCLWCHKGTKYFLHASLDFYVPKRYGLWNKYQEYQFHQHVNPYIKDTPLSLFVHSSSQSNSTNQSSSFNSSNESSQFTKFNESTNLEFCDLACAKFFNDNVAKIKLDFDSYRMLYLEDKLNKEAKNIYEKCKNKDFAMLTSAIYDGPLDAESIKLQKNKYIRCID